uniref:Uncharacterized protein n=1 Tax=Oryza punctata TaxID=4537 RepID=A0A0E0LZJ4_ORYPU
MGSGNDDETAIDIESLVKELLSMSCTQRGDETGNKRSTCKIARLNEQMPNMVCIGPYYNDPLHRMESEKMAVLVGTLPVDKQHKADMLTRLVNAIIAVENEARDHYADRANRMSRMDFVHMLILDGCYILGKFVLPDCCSSDGGSKNGGRSAMQDTDLVRDVFYLVDNQIPFCVLNTMHKVLHGKIITSPTAVADVLFGHVREHLGKLGYSKLHVGNPSPCWHLLHLLHKHFQLTDNDAKVTAANDVGISCGTVYRWRQATQYHAAGVRLKKRRLGGSTARTILDVKLEGLTLRVPSLTVDNNTCRMLRNLMALEQQNQSEIGNHVTAYCLFMSQIACTASDVELLVKKGIIVHALRTDSDVAERLTALCSGVIIDLDEVTHNYLCKTRKNLERIYKSRKVNCLTLPRRNPWLVVALLATIVVLVCQLLQAVYTTKSYYQSLHGIDVMDKLAN